jgi:nuclear pore complex protein Nup93
MASIVFDIKVMFFFYVFSIELNHLVMMSSFQERDLVLEQETVLRQLEAILSVLKLARLGHFLDALRELAKLPFLPLDPRVPDITVDVLQNLSPRVQDCVPDLLKVALTCLDNVTDSDGSLRAMKAKVF